MFVISPALKLSEWLTQCTSTTSSAAERKKAFHLEKKRSIGRFELGLPYVLLLVDTFSIEKTIVLQGQHFISKCPPF